MASLRDLRASLVQVARRYSRVHHEAEDLAHDLLVSALGRGASLDEESFARSMHGSARRHGAFLARSAARRRARESAVASGDRQATIDDGRESASFHLLSPPLRTTLQLLLLGLDKGELKVALGVTDAALRKRFQALRELGPLPRPRFPLRRWAHGLTHLRRTQVRLLPQLAGTLPAQRVLAASDPDGHGLIFVQALTSGPAAATPSASHRAPTKGPPC